MVKHIPGDHVGIHAHNDTEQAVAISLAAVRAGARQIQGTLNGLGERCGNANLVSIIPTLKLKPEYAEKFDIGVSDDKLKTLAHASHTLDEMLNRAPNRHAPYVGESAFATKAGIHASAIVKDPATYEHVAPETVGNRRKLLVSDQAGRSNVLAELDRIGLKVDKDDSRVGRLLDEVKEREAIGYAYEAADASFDLLARRVMGQVPNYFDVTQFDVNVEQRAGAKGERETVCLAVVKVKVGNESMISAAEGNGPVNALDLALRKDLGKYQGYISGLELTDYRVRILNGGTEAVTRVLIESQDETGEHWTTVGVSPNIIDASFQALMDSIVYKLVKSGAPAVSVRRCGTPRRPRKRPETRWRSRGRGASASHPLGGDRRHFHLGFRDQAGRFGQLRQDVLDAVGDQHVDREARPDEQRLAHVVEQGAERVPEARRCWRSGSASCAGRVAPR